MGSMFLFTVLFIIQIGVFFALYVLISKKSKNEELLTKLNNFQTLLEKSDTLLRDELARNREESNNNARSLREETSGHFKTFQEMLNIRLNEIQSNLKTQMNDFTERFDKASQLIDNHLQGMREKLLEEGKSNRAELKESLQSFENRFSRNVNEMNDQQKQKFDSLITNLADTGKQIEERLDKMRSTIETQLKSLQDENSKKLDEMRLIVDEKLQSTLEKRLGESFKQVSERLEQVHQGLGDMKNLAIGVGDLKNVLTNVKTRGIMGEYQLENLLEQLFTPNQYEKQFRLSSQSDNRVDFAVKLPGKDENRGCIYLPLDAKYPMNDYYLLQDAYGAGDVAKIETIRKELVKRIRSFAKDIHEKYIHPPETTDFAIMFLPSEGLYAEVLSKTELFEQIMRDYKVVITGPTTLAAFLNSLQMGFQTLAIEKRSSEVWMILGAVKKEFEKFGDILEKAHKNINGAGKELETLIGTRTRAINRKLRTVKELNIEQENLLELEIAEEGVSSGDEEDQDE